MSQHILSRRSSAVATFVLLASLCAFAQKNSASATDARIQRVETDLVSIPMSGSQPPLQYNLQQLMKALNVPGLTVTAIDDFKPAWTKTYGVTEAGTSTPVTAATLFQAGSISKPVTATGALYLVEQGKLSLDANINDYLKTWKVPDNEFTATQKVTLRRLLSHSAGLTVHGFPGYAVGEPIPTTCRFSTVRNRPTPNRSAWTSFRAPRSVTPAVERRSFSRPSSMYPESRFRSSCTTPCSPPSI